MFIIHYQKYDKFKKVIMIKFLAIINIICATIILSSCSGEMFTVHRIDVQQGNAIEPEKVEQLKVGMTKEQVKFLMGSPLITDVFHPDRWDYVFHLIPDYGDSERYHLTVFFDGDKVSEIQKGDMPKPDNEIAAQ